jgi:hypothetical protein
VLASNVVGKERPGGSRLPQREELGGDMDEEGAMCEEGAMWEEGEIREEGEICEEGSACSTCRLPSSFGESKSKSWKAQTHVQQYRPWP